MGEGRVAPPLEVSSKNNIIYLFTFGCPSRPCSEGCWWQRVEATLCCHVWASHCAGFSWGAQTWKQQALVVTVPGLQSTGPVFAACGPTCSSACGIFLVQGSDLCLLHWQADSLPLSHQGSPAPSLLYLRIPPIFLLQSPWFQVLMVLESNTQRMNFSARGYNESLSNIFKSFSSHCYVSVLW